MEALTGEPGTTIEDPLEALKAAMKKGTPDTDQNRLLQQLRDSLSTKNQGEGPSKMLLRNLLTAQNKTTTPVGVNTLREDILGRILRNNPEGDKSMAEWLASLNKQEEGESHLLFRRNGYEERRAPRGEGDPDIKPPTIRSGILDKAVSNIRRKEIWPQQNLGEDWAEDQVEFKQMRFEHLVVGECRTIETCTEPA